MKVAGHPNKSDLIKILPKFFHKCHKFEVGELCSILTNNVRTLIGKLCSIVINETGILIGSVPRQKQF